MTYSGRRTRLNTLPKSKAERIVFERLWAAFDDCDPRIMVTPETNRLIETTRERIIAGEPLLRSDLTNLMTGLRNEPDPGCKEGRPPFIWVLLVWFLGFIAEYVEQNGDGPLPMGVALEAMCIASDSIFAVVKTEGRTKSLHVLDRTLELSGTLDLAQSGPSLAPSRQLRAELRQTFGRSEDTMFGDAA